MEAGVGGGGTGQGEGVLFDHFEDGVLCASLKPYRL